MGTINCGIVGRQLKGLWPKINIPDLLNSNIKNLKKNEMNKGICKELAI